MVDTTAPVAPVLDSAAASSPTTVSLEWLPPYDEVGVTAFLVYRDDNLIVTLGAATRYEDFGLTANTTYIYKLKARDAVPNTSEFSNSLTVTTPQSSAYTDVPGRVEVDFGTTPVANATFTVTDGMVNAGSHIVAQVAWEAPNNKDIDEIEMDDVQLRCQPGAGTFTIFAQAADGSYLADRFKINYFVR